VVKDIAAELGTAPSRVALAWTLLNPTVTAPIVGARNLAQLEDNLGALDVQLDPGQQTRLAEVSAIELGFPPRGSPPARPGPAALVPSWRLAGK
jgi:aryl-alcohol dehydrogenase-like predicted oxidoreductase